jgi:peroxiredoxin
MQRYLDYALIGLVAILATPALGAPAAPRDAVAQCTRQLQAIGRALAAYQHDHGELPPHLSDLYPRYLTDKKLLHCPADASPGEPGLEGKVPAPIAPPADPRLPISYSYTMSTVIPHATFGTPTLESSRGPWNWRAQMLGQREWYGDWVPVVRCWHHVAVDRVYREPGVLNLALSGQVYRSTGAWNRYPAAVTEALSHLERELADGPEAFQHRWSAKWDEITHWIWLALGSQQPTPALRHRYHVLAEKLAVLDKPGSEGAGSVLSQALGTLYTAAGDREKAVAAYERALQADGDPRQIATSVSQIYLGAGQPDKAVAFLERVAALAPLNAGVIGELAYAYERAGQQERAAEWRRKVEASAQPVGQPAPDFTLRDADGQAVRLSDLRGKVVFLSFSASSCGPCRAEAPHLEALHRKYRDQGLVVLSLNREADHSAETSFARKTFTYPLLLDAGAVFHQYGIDALPTTFVIDRDGKIAGRHVGFGPGGETQFEEEVRKLLALRTTFRQ